MSKVTNRFQNKDLFSTMNHAGRFAEILSHFSNVKVLVIGDFILDEFVWGSVERISPEAPVPVVNVERESFVPGGALNVANNIRMLGGTVFPCGIIGRDLHGRMLVKLMRAEGIDTEGVIYDSKRPTTLKTRIIAHSQQMVRFDREVARELNNDQRNEVFRYIQKVMPQCDIVALEDYGKGVIEPWLLTRILKLAKSEGKPVIVDPKEKHFAYYRGVTAVTPNRKEAIGGLSREKNRDTLSIEQVGKKLLNRLGVEAVLITLGEEGMLLVEKSGEVTRIPTAARQVYDVSGAGDTVIAVFSMAIASGANKREAAYVANAAAGVVVGKLGTATLTMEELKSTLSLEKMSGNKKKELLNV